MEHFYHLDHIGEDWFTYASFYKTIVQNSSNEAHFVEVGSWKGKSSVFMAVEIINSGKNIKFDCVDYWQESIINEPNTSSADGIQPDDVYKTFLSNIEPVKHIINPIRMISTEASKLYQNKSLDFVFVDAGHTYEDVYNDITHWLPKIKNGGIISGHDYWGTHLWPGVFNAVNDFFKDKNHVEANYAEAVWSVRL